MTSATAGKTRRKWRDKATRRTTAIYFTEDRQIRLVKKAARRLGVPWTRFIREACLARAIVVVGGAANDEGVETREEKAS